MKFPIVLACAAATAWAIAAGAESAGEAVADPPASAHGDRPPRGAERRAMWNDDGAGGMDSQLLNALVHDGRLAEELQLSDAQKQKLEQALAEGREVHEKSQEQLRQIMMQQARLMSQKKVDEAALMSAIDEGFDIRKAMAKERVRHLLLLRDTLTPEQIDKAHALMKERMKDRAGEPRWKRSERGGAAGGAATNGATWPRSAPPASTPAAP